MKRPSNSNMNGDDAEDSLQVTPLGRPSRDAESWTASQRSSSTLKPVANKINLFKKKRWVTYEF